MTDVSWWQNWLASMLREDVFLEKLMKLISQRKSMEIVSSCLHHVIRSLGKSTDLADKMVDWSVTGARWTLYKISQLDSVKMDHKFLYIFHTKNLGDDKILQGSWLGRPTPYHTMSIEVKVKLAGAPACCGCWCYHQLIVTMTCTVHLHVTWH
jgi:hypothetical protein